MLIRVRERVGSWLTFESDGRKRDILCEISCSKICRLPYPLNDVVQLDIGYWLNKRLAGNARDFHPLYAGFKKLAFKRTNASRVRF